VTTRQDPAKLMRFLLSLRQQGITDPRVLTALELTPRADYAPAHLAPLALEDVVLPLAGGESMTAPSVIARMLAAADLGPGLSVLEIGTGSGYQTALIAGLGGQVTSCERRRPLLAEARAALGRNRVLAAQVLFVDAVATPPGGEPFERILINAALTDIPPGLAERLSDSGVLVAPILMGENTILTRFRHTRDGLQVEARLGPAPFAHAGSGVSEA
jgi:protein-L-isoaspartate(D-aspartate) O-methyltransferase